MNVKLQVIAHVGPRGVKLKAQQWSNEALYCRNDFNVLTKFGASTGRRKTGARSVLEAIEGTGI